LLLGRVSRLSGALSCLKQQTPVRFHTAEALIEVIWLHWRCSRPGQTEVVQQSLPFSREPWASARPRPAAKRGTHSWMAPLFIGPYADMRNWERFYHTSSRKEPARASQSARMTYRRVGDVTSADVCARGLRFGRDGG